MIEKNKYLRSKYVHNINLTVCYLECKIVILLTYYLNLNNTFGININIKFEFFFSILRCTLTSIPQTSSLLNKSRLPLGILIHPFKDLSVSILFYSYTIIR